MKILIRNFSLLASLFVSSLSFASPSGHQVCRDANRKFEFRFGTYAMSGDDGALKVDGKEFVVSAQPGDGFDDLTSRAEVFCLCQPPKGQKVADVKWDISAGELNDPKAIHMTIKRLVNGKVRVTEIDMTCESSDFKSGIEQN